MVSATDRVLRGAGDGGGGGEDRHGGRGGGGGEEFSEGEDVKEEMEVEVSEA